MRFIARAVEGESKRAFLNYYADPYSPYGLLVNVDLFGRRLLFGFRYSATRERWGWMYWRPE